MGSLSPVLEEKYKLRQPAYLAEIEFESLAEHAFAPINFEPIPRYPSSERDVSIVVSRDMAYHKIQTCIMDLKIAELVKIALVDVYEGKKIPSEKVSLTLRLTFQDRGKTLTVDRVQDFVDTVLSSLRKTYGAELRSK